MSFFSGSPLPVGFTAPGFTLPDQDGNSITLSELRGKNVVLIFYPADETPVCTRQLCDFRDQAHLWRGRNAVVFGVNPASGKKHQSFKERLALGFPLLVDHGGKVAEAYRCKGFLMTTRTVYLIGPDGRILYGKRGKPAPEEVLAAAEPA